MTRPLVWLIWALWETGMAAIAVGIYLNLSPIEQTSGSAVGALGAWLLCTALSVWVAWVVSDGL